MSEPGTKDAQKFIAHLEIAKHQFVRKVITGRIGATPGAIEAVKRWRKPDAFFTLFRRYLEGDWDEMEEPDFYSNIKSLSDEGRVLVAFHLEEIGETLWILTDAGHETTTILKPDEY